MTCSAALAGAGCSQQDLSKPPKVRYGRDICSQCRMIIGEERFACAAVSQEGNFFKFDDIGCLAIYEKNTSGNALRSWVQDAGGLGWMEKEKAYFIYSEDVITPMGYGIAAFAEPERAAEFAREKAGRLLAWNDIKTEEVK